jgi:hypothetical protein
MYGLPGQTPARWEESLAEALRLDVRYEAFLPTVSSYHIYPVIFTVQNIHHLKS